MLVQAYFTRDFKRKTFCRHRELSPQLTNSWLLAWTLHASQGFAPLRKITFLLLKASNLRDLRAVIKTSDVATGNSTQSLFYILLTYSSSQPGPPTIVNLTWRTGSCNPGFQVKRVWLVPLQIFLHFTTCSEKSSNISPPEKNFNKNRPVIYLPRYSFSSYNDRMILQAY